MHIMLTSYIGFALKTSSETFAWTQNLISRQAEWSEEVEDVKSAAEMYIQAKNYDKAVALLGKHGWGDMLLQVVREIDKTEKDLLLKCASYFRKHKNSAAAKETYLKMGDDHGLIQVSSAVSCMRNRHVHNTALGLICTLQCPCSCI